MYILCLGSTREAWFPLRICVCVLFSSSCSEQYQIELDLRESITEVSEEKRGAVAISLPKEESHIWDKVFNEISLN